MPVDGTQDRPPKPVKEEPAPPPPTTGKGPIGKGVPDDLVAAAGSATLTTPDTWNQGADGVAATIPTRPSIQFFAEAASPLPETYTALGGLLTGDAPSDFGNGLHAGGNAGVRFRSRYFDLGAAFKPSAASQLQFDPTQMKALNEWQTGTNEHWYLDLLGDKRTSTGGAAVNAVIEGELTGRVPIPLRAPWLSDVALAATVRPRYSPANPGYDSENTSLPQFPYMQGAASLDLMTQTPTDMDAVLAGDYSSGFNATMDAVKPTSPWSAGMSLSAAGTFASQLRVGVEVRDLWGYQTGQHEHWALSNDAASGRFFFSPSSITTGNVYPTLNPPKLRFVADEALPFGPKTRVMGGVEHAFGGPTAYYGGVEQPLDPLWGGSKRFLTVGASHLGNTSGTQLTMASLGIGPVHATVGSNLFQPDSPKEIMGAVRVEVPLGKKKDGPS